MLHRSSRTRDRDPLERIKATTANLATTGCHRADATMRGGWVRALVGPRPEDRAFFERARHDLVFPRVHNGGQPSTTAHGTADQVPAPGLRARPNLRRTTASMVATRAWHAGDR